MELDLIEIAQQTIQIIIAVFVALTGFLSYKKIEKNTIIKPTLQLEEVSLILEESKTYVGKNVPWGNEHPIEESGFEEQILSKGTKRKNTTLSDGDKKYIFFNLCPEDMKDTENVVLAFDVLKVKINFIDKDNKIDELHITDAFSVLENDEPVKEMKMHQVEYLGTHKPYLEIPLVYACVYDSPVSMNLKNIYEAKVAIQDIGVENSKINFMLSRYKAEKYMAFKETGCLIKCKTINNKTYVYSLYWEIKDGEFIPYAIRKGNKFYREKLRKRKIVQK